MVLTLVKNYIAACTYKRYTTTCAMYYNQVDGWGVTIVAHNKEAPRRVALCKPQWLLPNHPLGCNTWLK